MRCTRKPDRHAERFVERNHEDTIPHLRNAMMCAVDQGITSVVSHTIEGLDHLLNDVVPAEIENVRHVLHEKCQGLQFLNVVKIPQIQVSAWIDFESFWMLGNFTQLRPTNACVCLA